MSSPNGITVADAPVNVSDNALPPCSNSIRPGPTSVVDAWKVTVDSDSSNIFPVFCSNSTKPVAPPVLPSN